MHFVMTTSSSSACMVGCSLWLIYALPFRRLPARKPVSIFKLWAATAGTTQSQTLPDWEWTSSLPRRLGAQLNGQVSWELTGVGNGAGFYSRLVAFLGDLNQSHFYTLCACFPIWKNKISTRMSFVNHPGIYWWRGLVRVRHYYCHTPHPLLSVRSSSSFSSFSLPSNTADCNDIRRHYSQQPSCLCCGLKQGSACTTEGCLSPAPPDGSCTLKLVPNLGAALPLYFQQCWGAARFTPANSLLRSRRRNPTSHGSMISWSQSTARVRKGATQQRCSDHTHLCQGWVQVEITASSEQRFTPPALLAGFLSWRLRHGVAKHCKIPQEVTYHRVEESNATLELRAGFTELPKEKPSNRLLFTYAAVISL